MTLAARLADVRAQSERGEDAAWIALHALAGQMEAGGRGREDPTRAVFGLLGDRWSMLILLTLGAGEWRHATLRRIVGTLSIEGAISQRVLTSKLRAMERDGLVHRTVSDDVPPRVEYRLSDLGLGLLDRATALLRWVSDHRDAIDASRKRADMLTGR